MKNPSVVIGALTLTAILLAVILLSMPQREAQAVMNATGGNFTMITAGQAVGDEALTIIDNREEKVVVYRLTNNNNLELIGGVTSAQFGKYFAKNAPPK